MAELHSCYRSSPSDNRKHLKAVDRIQRKRDEFKQSPPALTPPPVACRLLLLHPLPAGSYSSTRCPPALTPPPILRGNFPTSVAGRKSITALSHISRVSSSESCKCWHLPALHPFAFPSSLESVFCWSCHRLQW